jgi:hypothetical protein
VQVQVQEETVRGMRCGVECVSVCAQEEIQHTKETYRKWARHTAECAIARSKVNDRKETWIYLLMFLNERKRSI